MIITYLFRAGRVARLTQGGNIPNEFFYGFPQLKKKGWNISIIEDEDLGMAPPLSPVAQYINKAARLFGGLPIGMVVPLFSATRRALLYDSDIVIATTNGMGLALGMAAMLGVIKKRVVLLGMGLLSKDSGGWQRLLYRLVLRNLFVVSISRSEQIFLSEVLRKRIVYVPFGVDKVFWAPDKSVVGDFVLAIGNDSNRDWQTLVDAWNLDLPPLKIVTSLPVPCSPQNVEVIKGDWRNNVISDTEIRNLFRAARFVVVPLKDTIQPAGQSVCLQAMACGKAVILTDIAGMWDRDLMVDGRTVVLTPPNDAAALSTRVRYLVNNPEVSERISDAGRAVVDQHLNSDAMAAGIQEFLEEFYD